MSEQLEKFIEGKIAEVSVAIKAREQAKKTWSGGAEASWKAVGCTLTKAQRHNRADIESRILIKLQNERDLFEQVLATMKGKQP